MGHEQLLPSEEVACFPPETFKDFRLQSSNFFPTRKQGNGQGSPLSCHVIPVCVSGMLGFQLLRSSNYRNEAKSEKLQDIKKKNKDIEIILGLHHCEWLDMMSFCV